MSGPPDRGSDLERRRAGITAATLTRRGLGVAKEAPTDQEQRDELRDMLDALGLLEPPTAYITDNPRAFSGPA